MAEPEEICELRIAVVKVEERMKVLESNIDRTLAEFNSKIADRDAANLKNIYNAVALATGAICLFVAVMAFLS